MRARPPVLAAIVAATALLTTGLFAAPAQAAATAKATVSTKAAPAQVSTPIHQAAIRKSCATPTKARTMACFALLRTDIGALHGSVASNVIAPNVTPSGYGPTDLDSAYKLSTAGGSGATVAIVDAYNDPTAAADLAVYRSQYGLPACTVASGCLQILNQNGATSPLPATDTGWAGEESLDLDMVSAICPNCHIALIEANSASDADLYAAEDRAATIAKFVSNSWGGAEYSGETTDDAHFNHPGVAITVSSGDDGYGAEYPSTSQYVTSVGGTSLTASAATRGWTEAAWNGSGSGCSVYEAKPSWQSAITACARRVDTDVSAVADPSTGLAVYETTGASGWVVYGGTSASSPIVAATYALAGTPAAGTYPASYPYAHTANLFDVTSGTNGTCSPTALCTAGAGWDGPTGLGTPNGTTAFTNGVAALAVNNPGNQTTHISTAVSLTVTATGGTPPYTWSATGLPTGLSINASTGVISGTTSSTPGTFSTAVTVTDSAGHSAITSFTWIVAATTTCTPAQLFTNPGFESGTAPWTATAGVIGVNGPSEAAHGGTADAWMDGYGTTHTDSVAQTVTIPTGCTGKVSFYLHIDTAETTTTTQFDKLTVQATVGTTTTTLATYSNLNHNVGYALFTLPITGTGTTKITFTGTEDSSLQTSFVIDDTALNVS